MNKNDPERLSSALVPKKTKLQSLQRDQIPYLLKNPTITGYPPVFGILLIAPPPTSGHLSLFVIVPKYITSICIKPCYDHLMKAIEEWWC